MVYVMLMSSLILPVWATEEQSKGLEFIIRDFPLEGAQRPEHVASSHYSQHCHIILAHLHPRHRDLICPVSCIYSHSTQEIILKVPVAKSPF